ncbi:serine/threonine protein kinase [Marinicrinis lubricantis]|uniref:Serine/threonine protein kinase n=1 Tax=Marinicrinis lubricantis TaxID=2086470 RepID=A0ABW1IL87_9BACL
MRLFAALASFAAAWRDYPAEVGAVLGKRYLVQEWLGEGSYGLTYKCIDQRDGTLVAVKQARPSKGNEAGKMLEREASILQSLDHAQIPAFHHFFTERRSDYLVMSYLSGDTLEDLIFEKGRRYAEDDCIHMTLQLLDIVTYIHEKGFVHLDLRIPNVIFQDERLYIIDFGLARRVGETLPHQPVRRGFPHKPSSSRPSKDAEEQSDLQDIGHWMLFILYSNYEPDPNANGEERSWQDELTLSDELRAMIERLLGIQAPYSGSLEFFYELKALAHRKGVTL